MEGKYFLFLAFIFLTLGVFNPPNLTEAAKVKVSHASPDLGTVNVIANSSIVCKGLHYKEVTDYLHLSGGSYLIELKLQGDDSTVLTQKIKIHEDKSYTLVAVGLHESSKASLELLILEDDNEAPEGAHFTRIRFVHASPGLPPIDVSDDDQSWFKDISYKETTKYRSVRAGTYPIEFYASGDTSPLLSLTLSLKGGEVMTVFVEGLLKDKTVDTVVTEDANFSYFRMRVSHSAPDAQPVDVYLDDGKNLKTIFSNVKFTDFTDYKLFVLDDYTLKIAPTGTKDYILTKSLSSKNVNVDTDYTFVIGGLARSSTLKAIFLEDKNFPPSNSGESLVRFFHASPGIPAIDIRINGELAFRNVDLLTATTYKKLRGIECQFEIFSAGSKVPILTFTKKLEGGQIYSIFIEGLLQQKTLQQVVALDASYQFFNLRVSHASPDTEPVDVLIDDGIRLRTLFSKIKFCEFTNYTLMVAKNYNLKITPSASHRKILASIDIPKNLTNPNAYFTLSLLGLSRSHSFEALLLHDEHKAPESSNVASVRFFHASPGTPPLDVSSSGDVWFHNVPYKGFTDYKSVRAGKYNILVVIKGERVPVANLTLDLKAGGVYSIFAEDLLKHLKAIIHEDAAYSFFNLRVAHASPDSPAVDVILDDGINQRRAFKGLKFGQIGSYEFMVLSEYTFLVTPENKRFPVLLSTTAESLCITPNSVNTLSIVGLSALDSLEFSVIQDRNEAPTGSEVGHVRFYHVSPGSPAFDFRIDGKLWFYRVAYKNSTNYRRVPSGTYECHVSLAGSTTPILNFTLVVKGGSINTVFLENLLKNLKAIVSVDAAFQFFTLRASHSSPDAPPVDVSLDDGTHLKKIASGLTFGKFSSYSVVVRANYKILVTPKDEKNSVLLSFDLREKTIERDMLYTFVIVGLFKQKNRLDGVFLKDNNEAPTDSQYARVRVFHASPDAPAIDVRVGDDYWAQDLNFKEETDYFNVNTGVYPIEILSKGELIRNFTLSFTGGKVYSLFLEGLLGNLEVVNEVDAAFNYFQLKVVHVSPTSPSLDFYLNENRIVTNLGPENFSPFITLVKHDYTLKLTRSGSKDPIYSRSFPAYHFKPNFGYVLIVMGIWESDKSPLDVVLTHEQLRAPDAKNETLFRFVNAAPSFKSLDARFNDLPLFLDSHYTSISPFRSLIGKPYHIGLYNAGTLKEPELWTSNNLEPGKVYTIYAEETNDKDNRIKLLINEETSFDFIRFRITHAAPDLGAVDIYLEDKKISRDLKYSHSTQFLEYLKGMKNLKVTPRNAMKPILIEKDIDFTANAESSLVLTGCLHKRCKRKADAIAFTNEWELPSYAKSFLRVFHGIPYVDRVDIKLNQHLIFANVAYGHETSYELMNSGAYLVQLYEAGTNRELVEMTVLLEDQIYTLFFAGFSYKKASGFMTPDYSQDPFANLRFLHASPDTSHIDVQLNGEGQFWDIPFAEGSDYKTLPAGSYDVRASLARQVSPLAKFDKIHLSKYSHNSLVLHGLRKGDSGLNVIQLEDDISLPPGDMIKVRFVHAVPDLGKIDLIANGRLIFANVSYASSTHYLTLSPADYSLTFSKPSGLTLSGGTLRSRGASVYTIVAEGLAKSDPPTARAVTFVDFAGPAPPKASKRMSTWKIILIVVGVLAGVALLVFGAFMLYRRRRAGQYQSIS